MDAFGDVTLVVEGFNFKCSKRKLAQHSYYFKTMFEGNFIEKDKEIITMKGIDVQSFKVCLAMLEKKDRKSIPKDEDLDLVLQTACMLQFQEILEFIGDKLLKNLSTTNCLDVWFFTQPFNLRPIYLSAKKMTLAEFHIIKSQYSLLKLTLEELHHYLGNKYLVCNEMDVFRTFMNWHCVNGNYATDVLACLDFNRLSNKDIEDMMLNIDAKRSLALLNVLKCILAVRKREYVKNLHLSLNLAHKLLNCNRRGCWTKPLFFKGVESEVKGIEDEDNEVAEDDGQGFWKALKLWMHEEEKLDWIFKHIIFQQKKQICLLRSQFIDRTWIATLWKYDSAGKCFVVGAEYEVHLDKIGEERNPHYSMALKDSVLELWDNANCCNYKHGLFIFCNRTKCAYFYAYGVHNYFELKIVDPKNFPNIDDNFSVYCVKDRIFVKDFSQLVELRVISDTLQVEKISALPPDDAYAVRDESELCHNLEYIISKDKNLLTLESEMVCRDQGVYRIGTLKYVYDTKCEMLWPDDHNLSGKDKYVNTIENLFGKRAKRVQVDDNNNNTEVSKPKQFKRKNKKRK